jgi:hypothetical protein
MEVSSEDDFESLVKSWLKKKNEKNLSPITEKKKDIKSFNINRDLSLLSLGPRPTEPLLNVLNNGIFNLKFYFAESLDEFTLCFGILSLIKKKNPTLVMSDEWINERLIMEYSPLDTPQLQGTEFHITCFDSALTEFILNHHFELESAYYKLPFKVFIPLTQIQYKSLSQTTIKNIPADISETAIERYYVYRTGVHPIKVEIKDVTISVRKPGEAWAKESKDTRVAYVSFLNEIILREVKEITHDDKQLSPRCSGEEAYEQKKEALEQVFLLFKREPISAPPSPSESMEDIQTPLVKTYGQFYLSRVSGPESQLRTVHIFGIPAGLSPSVVQSRLEELLKQSHTDCKTSRVIVTDLDNGGYSYRIEASISEADKLIGMNCYEFAPDCRIYFTSPETAKKNQTPARRMNDFIDASINNRIKCNNCGEIGHYISTCMLLKTKKQLEKERGVVNTDPPTAGINTDQPATGVNTDQHAMDEDSTQREGPTQLSEALQDMTAEEEDSDAELGRWVFNPVTKKDEFVPVTSVKQRAEDFQRVLSMKEQREKRRKGSKFNNRRNAYEGVSLNVSLSDPRNFPALPSVATSSTSSDDSVVSNPATTSDDPIPTNNRFNPLASESSSSSSTSHTLHSRETNAARNPMVILSRAEDESPSIPTPGRGSRAVSSSSSASSSHGRQPDIREHMDVDGSRQKRKEIDENAEGQKKNKVNSDSSSSASKHKPHSK